MVTGVHAWRSAALLLLGGKLADLLGPEGRRFSWVWLGFAGGLGCRRRLRSTSPCWSTARACQGAFAAVLVPSALCAADDHVHRAEGPRLRRSASTARSPTAGGAVGLLLGGAADRVPVVALDALRQPRSSPAWHSSVGSFLLDAADIADQVSGWTFLARFSIGGDVLASVFGFSNAANTQLASRRPRGAFLAGAWHCT